MTQRSGATISAHEHVAMIPPTMENRSRVSFIIPTLNTEAILEICLVAITRQIYPRDRYEIILADAHSTDRTREIGKKFGAIILDDDRKNIEEGKRLALHHATGKPAFLNGAANLPS